jgi:uncharacterized repeat protein (TIGR03803 family)
MPSKKASFILMTAMVMFVAVVIDGDSASAQTERVLHNFGGPGDGWEPVGGLLFDSSGNLYGPTFYGGSNNECGTKGCGTVFELRANPVGNWSETVIYNLDGGQGAHPVSPLIFDPQGNLYGTAWCNQEYCYYQGEVFQLSPNSNGTWTPTTLHAFPAFLFDGGSPVSLVLDDSGNLYGEAQWGGLNNTGLIFELNRAKGWRESLLYVFGPYLQGDGANPVGAFARDAEGNLYGTTQSGGADRLGIVFELMPEGSVFWRKKVLYTFSDHINTIPNGVSFGPDGNLYGTTQGGGANGRGSVFSLTPNSDGTWSETDLYAFSGGSDGAGPLAGVVFDGSGNLYGTTAFGGTGCNGSGCGTAYQLSPSPGGGWSESILYRFTGGLDGGSPGGVLVLDQVGNLYGVTGVGGIYGNPGGVVFEITR